MSTALCKAIDDLLAFGEEPLAPIPYEGERRDRFDELDGAVWVEACRMGCEAKLPQESDPNFHYLGETKLPGFWAQSPSAFHLDKHDRLRRWKNRLLALRRLAETTESPFRKSLDSPAAAKDGPGQTGTKIGSKKRGRRSTMETDQKIFNEYYAGLEAGEWEGQADYLRKKRPKGWSSNLRTSAARLNKLLKRVEENQTS